ncbi:probable BOI-related E3 ubiquitin-protein ligase 2 [Vicia villosa]|uniref:probable BOI-related E3 ubiquitin-protein ligase 2 n=1 Tax=Vicia villosa TaxID=3911 RepID=UPI00273A93DE|nr:probable BOI-related E3 ubiquitin-protein ligase 2 [Vicia villosa]
MAMLPYSDADHDFFSCGFVELHQPHHQQHHQHQWLRYVHASNTLNSTTIVTLLKKQEQETNQFLKIQTDQMKFMLQHQRELQEGAIRRMKIYLQQILKTKDGEIAKGAKKYQELKNIIKSLESEQMKLKRMTEENGAMAIYLHNKLEEGEKRLRILVGNNDAESCCGENEEARAKKHVRHGSNNIICCSMCNRNSPSVLFLPCRHISSCKACEASLQSCLICGVTKKGAIEIQSYV